MSALTTGPVTVEASTTAVPTTTRRRSPRADVAMAIAVMVLVLAVGFSTDNFFSSTNLKAILASASIVGIAALGSTVIMIVGGAVSMATATVASLSAMLFIGYLDTGLALAIAVALAFGAVTHACLGWLVGSWAVNPIILTIAAGSLLEGLVLAIRNGQLVSTNSDSLDVLNATVGGAPVSVPTFVILAIVVHLGLTLTPWGRRIYLVGGNREAARVAGFKIGRVTALAFAIGGMLTAVAGIFLGAVNTNASLEVGGTLTFDAVAAALVGGTSINGGRGSVLRTLAGAIAVAAISDLLLLRGFSSGAQICVKGLLVLAVVVLVHIRSGEGSAA